MAAATSQADAGARGLRLARRLLREARAQPLSDLIRLLTRAFRDNDLLGAASAISFQLCFALIPAALFGLGVLGGSGLSSVWTDDLAPKLRGATSPAAYEVIDQTVRRILGERQLFWLTFGALLAVWKLSSAVRRIMDVLDRTYGGHRRRSGRERLRVSVQLAVAAGLLVLAALAVVQVLPLLVPSGPMDSLVAVLRWPVAAALLFAMVALLVRVAPTSPQPAPWVTFGSLLVVVAWLLSSLAFAWYLTSVADYGSVFGNLATVMVVLQYVFLSTVAFLTGVQLDALVRERLDAPGGARGGGRGARGRAAGGRRPQAARAR